MRCTGCGAKVGPLALEEVLNALPELGTDQIRPERADDASVVDPPDNQVLVQTVDQLRSFVADPYLFGRIVTLHAASDLFAMGVAPHSALASVTLPAGPRPRLVRELLQLLSGVLRELEAMGASLIGGHTGEGELSLGLAMNGFGSEEKLAKKSELVEGDALVLTGPLGTGTILAAHMHGRASGSWVDGAIDSMLQSNQAASRILMDHGVESLTDVTGFGLAGHLHQMLAASGVGAELTAADVPLLPGVPACLGAGMASTAAPENHAFAQKHYPGPLPGPDSVLYDPQTSGPLLAGVRPEKLNATLSALREAGYQAASVGRVLPSDTGLTVLG